MTKRKTFISYYHNDKLYKEKFTTLFDELIINKSVEDGDINGENSDEYIKQLIQKKHLFDTTVLIVLIGSKTRCRKHVDWEIYGALNFKVGEHYAGLLGIILPTHPDYGKNNFNPNNIPKRLAENLKTGYAKIVHWTTNKNTIKNRIDDAFNSRKVNKEKRTNSLIQMQKNTCN